MTESTGRRYDAGPEYRCESDPRPTAVTPTTREPGTAATDTGAISAGLCGDQAAAGELRDLIESGRIAPGDPLVSQRVRQQRTWTTTVDALGRITAPDGTSVPTLFAAKRSMEAPGTALRRWRHHRSGRTLAWLRNPLDDPRTVIADVLQALPRGSWTTVQALAALADCSARTARRATHNPDMPGAHQVLTAAGHLDARRGEARQQHRRRLAEDGIRFLGDNRADPAQHLDANGLRELLDEDYRQALLEAGPAPSPVSGTTGTDLTVPGPDPATLLESGSAQPGELQALIDDGTLKPGTRIRRILPDRPRPKRAEIRLDALGRIVLADGSIHHTLADAEQALFAATEWWRWTEIATGRTLAWWRDPYSDPAGTVATVLAALPRGAWTSLEALADLTGHPRSAIGAIASPGSDLPGGHRILRGNGQIRRRHDEHRPAIRQRLQSEGVRFTTATTADPTQHQDAGRLRDLLAHIRKAAHQY